MPRICLVTPGHVASNPRLVKEADALHVAGYDVHVVALRYFPVLDAEDANIYRSAPWSHTLVDVTRGIAPVWSKLLRRAARLALTCKAPITPSLAARAHHAAISALATAAAQTKADLYIGHCLAGLAAATMAARRTGARHGFDAEDFHSAETAADAFEHRIITRLEAHCLPGCATFTAASPLIGRAYRETYALASTPLTVLNTFPLKQAPASPPAAAQYSPMLRLYWFSQTIGPGRGLDPLISVLGRMKHPASLHLRGLPSTRFPDELRALARKHNWFGEIEFLPFAPPDEMPRLAAGYDLGLSLELRTPRNRDLCLTNKIFTYLLAGLPVALSSTSAQDALRPDLGPAALPLNLADPDTCARTLDEWWSNKAVVLTAHQHAWQLGQTRYNWEHDKHTLLAAIAGGLPR